MIAGIMQPYFFPYLGYFALIARADVWMAFDITQYTTKSWMTRNRILHPSEDWQYISVPVSKPTGRQLMSSMQIKDIHACKVRVLGQVEHYKKHAPHYGVVTDLIKKAFDATRSPSLVELNISTLRVVCEYLGIAFAPIIASEKNFSLPTIEHAGQWALEICVALGADTYINPPAGRGIFRCEEFGAKNIHLGFTELIDFVYVTSPYTFVPHLSILDVLMWNSPETIRTALYNTEVEYAC